jgi:hypothetical protein
MTAHQGTDASPTGSQNGTPWIDEDPTPTSKSEALRALAEGGDIAGMASDKYLREDRRIDAPHPADLKHWANARTGETALLAPLYLKDEVVAVQAIYLDPAGHKSPVDPTKQRLSIKRAPGAVFCLPYDGDRTDVVTCDGLEDSLSVWRYGAQLPGIGALRHQKFPEGTKVTVVADGDPPGSKGAELLQKGLDALILQGCEVFVTATPPEGRFFWWSMASRRCASSLRVPNSRNYPTTAKFADWPNLIFWLTDGKGRKQLSSWGGFLSTFSTGSSTGSAGSSLKKPRPQKRSG